MKNGNDYALNLYVLSWLFWYWRSNQYKSKFLEWESAVCERGKKRDAVHRQTIDYPTQRMCSFPTVFQKETKQEYSPSCKCRHGYGNCPFPAHYLASVPLIRKRNLAQNVHQIRSQKKIKPQTLSRSLGLNLPRISISMSLRCFQEHFLSNI